MQDHQPQTSSDEIDLSVVFDKIKSLFKSLLVGVVMIFHFFWKHKIRLIILLIIGLVIQFFASKTSDKIYTNEFLVKTNYESTEYLYSKVKSIHAKLTSEDTLYLKDVFGEEYKRLKEIEVVPVVDVYNLVNSSEANMETFELLLDEYGDISFLEEEININEYPTHKIKIHIQGIEDNELIANNLYTFLSNNSYYNNLKLTALESYKEQLVQNKIIRAQIDSIIKDQKSRGALPKIDNSGVTFSGSQDLGELLKLKEQRLIIDLELRTQLSSEDEVLKIIDSSFGVLSKERTPNYLLIPLFLLGVYSLFFFFRFIGRKILLMVEKDH